VRSSGLFSPLKGVSVIEKTEGNEVKNEDRRSFCDLHVYEQGIRRRSSSWCHYLKQHRNAGQYVNFDDMLLP
jgi:hypothetical protein